MTKEKRAHAANAVSDGFKEFTPVEAEASTSGRGCLSSLAMAVIGLGTPAAVGMWMLPYTGPVASPVSAFFLLCTEVFAFTEWSNWTIWRRIRRAPATKIRDAKEGLVQIRGVLVGGASGLVHSPCTGQLGVWVELVTDMWVLSGRDGWWKRLLSEAAARELLVDDGSGSLASIDSSAMNVVGEPTSGPGSTETGWRVVRTQTHSVEYERSGQRYERFTHRFNNAMDSYLASKLDSDVVEHSAGFRVTERILRPGDRVAVVGLVRRDRGESKQAAHPGHILLSHGTKVGEELDVFLGTPTGGGIYKVAWWLGLALVTAAVGVLSTR